MKHLSTTGFSRALKRGPVINFHVLSLLFLLFHSLNTPWRWSKIALRKKNYSVLSSFRCLSHNNINSGGVIEINSSKLRELPSPRAFSGDSKAIGFSPPTAAGVGATCRHWEPPLSDLHGSPLGPLSGAVWASMAPRSVSRLSWSKLYPCG